MFGFLERGHWARLLLCVQALILPQLVGIRTFLPWSEHQKEKMSGFRPCSVQKKNRFTYFVAEHGGIVLHPEGVD